MRFFLFKFISKFFQIIFYWLCYYSCPDFPPLPPQPSTSHSLRQSPHHCSCPWVMRISSLATPFPILYFMYPRLFCNYLFVLFNPLTSSSIPPHRPAIWQPSKCSPYPWFCLCSSCLLSLLFSFNSWYICIYCHFIVHSFDFFLKEVPLTFHVIMVW